MKLPTVILQGMAVALTGAGLAGCGIIKSTPTSSEPPVENTQCEPDGHGNAPGGNPGRLPDNCPACGRG